MGAGLARRGTLVMGSLLGRRPERMAVTQDEVKRSPGMNSNTPFRHLAGRALKALSPIVFIAINRQGLGRHRVQWAGADFNHGAEFP